MFTLIYGAARFGGDRQGFWPVGWRSFWQYVPRKSSSLMTTRMFLTWLANGWNRLVTTSSRSETLVMRYVRFSHGKLILRSLTSASLRSMDTHYAAVSVRSQISR
jgi:hypothetical protein